MELFIHAADKDDVKQTINRKTLEPVIQALLSTRWPVLSPEKEFMAEWVELNPEMAEVAKLFIEAGFNYLSKQEKNMTISHEQTMCGR